MKAKDWVAKFEAVPASDAPIEERFAGVFKEFGKETAELVAARTKNSKPESRLPAAEGAVREQKTKFRAICIQVPTLSEAFFDFILASAVPEYAVWQAASQKQPEKPADDVREYRKRRGR